MEGAKRMRIVITGSGGLIGRHAAVRLHAENCAARFKKLPMPHEVVLLNHADFANDTILAGSLYGADAVLHFAGVNRASDADLASGNPDIASRLVAMCRTVGCTPPYRLCKFHPRFARHRLRE